MKQIKFYVFPLFVLGFSFSSFSQSKKSERDLEKYLQVIKALKVDTFLVVKSGCIGCNVEYADTTESVNDGQSIYVLTQKGGQFKLGVFDDIHKPKYSMIDTCSLFKLISLNQVTLERKEKFYKDEIPKIKSKSGFYPPRPIHYSYEGLEIKISNFSYNFIIVNDAKDHFGMLREKERWFALTSQIIKRVYNY